MKPVETIAYMIIQEECVLAEKRSLTKKVCPGMTTIPGGHVDAGETVEDALKREIYEELGIICEDYAFVCALLHREAEFRKLNYFVVNAWRGEMKNHEAEALVWIRLDDLDALDLEVDRMAVREYVRVYGSQQSF